MTNSPKDITAKQDIKLTWDNAAVQESLSKLHEYVVSEAIRSESWYWEKKSTKALWSRIIQFTSITFAALGGLFPVVAKLGLLPDVATWLRARGVLSESAIDTGLWSSCFLGVAAALVGLDRFFGFSSGWARYVLTGSTIRKTLEEFRMDWALLVAQLSLSSTPDQVAAAIHRAKEFRLAVEGLVLKETQDWATEFQNNIAQMEKDLRGQADRLKSEAQKADEARAQASQPGSIEAMITNADKTDQYRFEALLESSEATIAEQTVTNSKTWARLAIAPGQYTLTIRGTVSGKPISGVAVVVVKPNEVAKPVIALPL